VTTADSRASGLAQRYAKVRKGMHLRFVRYAVNPLVFRRQGESMDQIKSFPLRTVAYLCARLSRPLLCRGAAQERGSERCSVAPDESSYGEFKRIKVLGLREAALKINLNFILGNPFNTFGPASLAQRCAEVRKRYGFKVCSP
jgi:hypothetical protein